MMNIKGTNIAYSFSDSRMKKSWDKNSRFMTILDQVVNSGSNFVVVALVANVAPVDFFGQFSIAYAALIFFLGVQRALIGETLVVYYSEGSKSARDLGPAIGASFTCGLGACLLILLPAFVLPPESRLLWVLMACGAVPILIQDSLRYVCIVRRESAAALILDLIWTIPAIAGMVTVVIFGAAAESVIAIWLVGALVSMVWGLVRYGGVPHPIAGAKWLARHRSSSLRFFGEFAILNVSTFVVWILLVPIIGAAGVGALRGAQLLFSPLNTAFNAVRLAVIPELIRSRQTIKFRKQLIEAAIGLGAIFVAWTILILLLNDGLGELILGDTWAAASKLRVEFSAQYVSLVAYTVLLVIFRSVPLNRTATKMRAWLAVFTLVLPLILAMFLGATGAAWGFAAGIFLSVLIGSAAYIRHRWNHLESTAA